MQAIANKACKVKRFYQGFIPIVSSAEFGLVDFSRLLKPYKAGDGLPESHPQRRNIDQ